jgi:hypothetical protein
MPKKPPHLFSIFSFHDIFISFSRKKAKTGIEFFTKERTILIVLFFLKIQIL